MKPWHLVSALFLLLLRHASSRHVEQRVVDSDLAAYLAGTPGIVVLRPQSAASR